MILERVHDIDVDHSAGQDVVEFAVAEGSACREEANVMSLLNDDEGDFCVWTRSIRLFHSAADCLHFNVQNFRELSLGNAISVGEK